MATPCLHSTIALPTLAEFPSARTQRPDTASNPNTERPLHAPALRTSPALIPCQVVTARCTSRPLIFTPAQQPCTEAEDRREHVQWHIKHACIAERGWPLYRERTPSQPVVRSEER